jgi:ribosomal protein S18 acetylase RimI-like enzyme
MNVVKITDENINLLEIFLKNKLPSTFRYFSKRNFRCVKTHILTVIGTIDSVPIAYGHIDKDQSDTYWLGVCVLEDFQSKGYGSDIIKYLIEHLDIPTIYLTVDKVNNKALLLYKRFGFEVTDEFDTFYKMRLHKKLLY